MDSFPVKNCPNHWNDYFKKKYIEFFREAFECTLNRLTKEFVRTVPNTDPPPETDIVGLRKININGVDIKREPVDENTLIALFYQMVNYPTHKGMGLVIQIPISGQITMGGLTAALSFKKSARIFIAAL